ncbi:MAG: DUF7487 domain-containing protein [Nitrosopumilaceae archaeon]
MLNTTEVFIAKATEKHKNKYGYTKIAYNGAHNKVIISCPIHGDFKQTPSGHIHGEAGCPRCGSIKQRQTMLKKYGVEHPGQSKEIQNKRKQTMLERYGVAYATQSSFFKEKTKQTNLEKYGVEHVLQSNKIREKIKQTNIERYNVEYSLANKEIREKIKQTNIERYNVEFIAQSPKIREKIKQTNIERYNVEHPFQSKAIQRKVKQTIHNNYGVKHLSQRHMTGVLLLLENYDWFYNEYIKQGKAANQIGDQLNISGSTVGCYLKKHNIAIKLINGFSYKCIQWLETIMEKENIFIQHAQNIGEYKIPNTKLRADGYCEKTNTIYEFHGDIWHGNPNIFERHKLCNPFSNLTADELHVQTLKREEFIRGLGYNLVTIWENEWN